MPKMDGYTFVRRLKKKSETADIPLVILTSYEPLKGIFDEEGVSDYFVKTVDMKLLYDVVRKKLSVL